jgi:hypothetical protein
VAVVKSAIGVSAILALNLGVLVFLGGGGVAALVFILFVTFFLLPAFAIAARAPHLRSMPPGLRLTASGVVVVLFAVPWFFARKATGMPLITDVVASIALTLIAARFTSPRSLLEELRPALRRLVDPVLIVLPLLFALVWLGFEVRVGSEVRYYGLLAVDFGNLASVVTTLRVSPFLPLSYIAGASGFSYHWLYFTVPATLSDFLGARIPSANALILTNLLMAALLYQTIDMVAHWFDEDDGGRGRQALLVAAVVVFAPFTTYFYQVAGTRFPLGWFALPTRNHLLLSPLNSMVTFGNNTVALVLALFVVVELERWNRDAKLGDALLGVTALALAIGYSVTLVFSLGIALVVWTLLGRVRRPAVALGLALLVGACVAGIFFAIGLLTTGGSRHVAVGFDHGQFFRMVLFGLAPLWAAIVLAGGRTRLSIFHILIVSSIAVPSMLYTTGSSGAGIDFSMKTGSLVAIAFTPLLVPAFRRLFANGVPRWRAWAAVFVIALGVVQTAAFVLQFPWYRARQSTGHPYSVPTGYHDALIWVRDNTPAQAIVVDPQYLTMPDLLYTIMIGERRVWLPTAYTNMAAIAGSHVEDRVSIWNAFAAGDAAAGRRIAAEADYLVVPGSIASSYWREVRRGSWSVFESTVRKP